MELSRKRLEPLLVLGGLVSLVDTIWMGLATLGLDLSRTNELILAISFVLGFPAYLVDSRTNKRIAISLLVLITFRWIATCFAGPTPVLCSPWRGNQFLIVAFVLLQASKLRREVKRKQTASAFENPKLDGS